MILKKVYEIAKNKSYLQKGVKIYWECNKSLLNRNSNISNKEVFQSDGLADFLKNETNQKNILHEKICYQSGDFSDKKGKIEFSLQFNKEKLLSPSLL